MADSAFQIQYRQEFIAQFEQGASWLRTICTTEAVIKGNQAMFLVAGSGGATAVTRGLNGNIPPRVDSLTQVPATLIEWRDKPQRTEFNIFAAEQCFAFHRNAVGHAVNTGEMDVRAGYNEENAYYWARSSIFMGSALLQNSGVVVVNHDGSKYT